MNRRHFFRVAGIAATVLQTFNIRQATGKPDRDKVVTVTGEIESGKMGITLSHEHILVDFSGADNYDPTKWDYREVMDAVIPHINQIRKLGCHTLVECTPEYIGRDPALLKRISESTGIRIITNTGYYGAADNKFLPMHAYSETPDQLAGRWVREFENGIGDTGIKPGFMKIGVAPGALSALHQKLVIAAAHTHLKTGMVIASHTGPATPAFEAISILKSRGVRPDAFIWVHSQNEEDDKNRIKAAEMGAWVSIDGLNENNVEQYVNWLILFRERGLLHRVLVSHDAGWYSPDEPGGGEFRPFTTVFNRLLPSLNEHGFSKNEIDRIFIENPAEAFTVSVRRI